MVDFTDSAAPGGFFAPERYEADIFDCEVEGAIPSEIDGVFVRVGGQFFYPSNHEHDVPFSNDGYVSKFRIKDGVADFSGRWVKTPRFINNLKARRQLYGLYRNPYTHDPSVSEPDKPYLATVMNTAPVAHAGKLFALKEDAQPYELDPNTLETIGPWDFHGGYKAQTFSAHPKPDPVSGDLIAYGYEATGLLSDDLWVYTINREGRVTREWRLKVPYVSAIHDIVLTQEHIIFPIFGYVTNEELLKNEQVHWAWDPRAPTYYGVLPRDGDASDVRWFKGPTRSIFHTFNGRTEGNKVILEAPISDANPFPFFPSLDGTPWDPVKARHTIRRVTLDLNSKNDSYEEEILSPAVVSDLGRVDERYLSLPNRYLYSGIHDPDKPFDQERAGEIQRAPVNSYFRYDLYTGRMDTFFVGDTHSLQEVSFIPRSKDAPEGDGYLIGVASNYAELRSEMVIIDALSLEESGRVILPFRSTPQVHGRWYNADELPLKDMPIEPTLARTQTFGG